MNNFLYRFAVFFLPATVALAGCSPIYVNNDFDRSANFSAYHTFAFSDSAGTRAGANPLLESRVRTWIEEELGARGLTRSDGSPDLLVNFVGDAREAVDIRTTGSGYGFNRYTSTINYKDGTILIDLIDASSKQLVWRGTADLTLSDNPTTDEVNNSVRSAIQRILAQYPPEL